TLANPNDPLSLQLQTDKVTLNGHTYTTVFDAATKQITTTTPVGRQRTIVQDGQGRMVELQIPALVPLQFAYDPRGRLATVTQATRQYTLSYDAHGNLASVTDPLSRTVGLTYSPTGQVMQTTLPDSRVIQYTYDENGNLASVTPPGRPDHTFTYTAVDLVQ